MSIRVVIADDQDLVRAGFRMILDATDGIEVVGEAADGRRAVAEALRLRPDVCLFDIRMPGIDGIEATRRVAGPGASAPLKVVIVTTFDLDDYVYDALAAGATGFLLKNAGPELLIEAVRAASAGDCLISPSITTRLIRRVVVRAPARTGDAQPVALTDREETVLAAIAAGLTNAEIGEQLYITLSTVKAHVANLMTKLHARNRVELVIWAYETGRVTGGDR
jgi:DNA-binding NarL/FixJ family response regulator